MKGFVADIEKLTEENADFRRVLYTGNNLQLVLMAIQSGEEIGEEVHDDRDQFFRIEKGAGEVRIDGNLSKVKSGDAIIVPAGARHNIKNTADKPCCSIPCMLRLSIGIGRNTLPKLTPMRQKSILTARQANDVVARGANPR